MCVLLYVLSLIFFCLETFFSTKQILWQNNLLSLAKKIVHAPIANNGPPLSYKNKYKNYSLYI